MIEHGNGDSSGAMEAAAEIEFLMAFDFGREWNE